MERNSADGIIVCMWSDGAVTSALGRRIPGVPVVRPKCPEAATVARRAGRLFMGEACIHNFADLAGLYKACTKVARVGGLPGDVRAAMRVARNAVAIPFVVTECGWDGKPVEKQAVFRLGALAGTFVTWRKSSGYEVGDWRRAPGRSAIIPAGRGETFSNLSEVYACLAGRLSAQP
jgi:hypothetical protein